MQSFCIRQVPGDLWCSWDFGSSQVANSIFKGSAVILISLFIVCFLKGHVSKSWPCTVAITLYWQELQEQRSIVLNMDQELQLLDCCARTQCCSKRTFQCCRQFSSDWQYTLWTCVLSFPLSWQAPPVTVWAIRETKPLGPWRAVPA